MADALPLAQWPQPAQLFGRYPGSIKRGLNKVGQHWFCDADARQWDAWGFDYVKYDWHPSDGPTPRRLATGLRDTGRDIVVSLSNAAEFDCIPELSTLANLCQTTGDIHESWESINRIGFSQDKWQPFSPPLTILATILGGIADPVEPLGFACVQDGLQPPVPENLTDG